MRIDAALDKPWLVLFTLGDERASWSDAMFVLPPPFVLELTAGVTDAVFHVKSDPVKLKAPVALVRVSTPALVKVLDAETVNPSAITDASPLTADAIVASEAVVFIAAVVLVL